MERKIQEIAEFLRASHGIDISGFDPSFVGNSINRRRSIYKDYSHTDYLHRLAKNSEEVDLLVDSLHISYSEFFRNPLTFSCLEQLVLPQLLATKIRKKEQSIRIWSAACASGQEPYSLAILVDELSANYPGQFNFKLFATDNNPAELSKASLGIFQANTLTKLTLKRAQIYFTWDGANYTISPHLKKNVDFSFFDLLSDSRTCPEPSIYGNFDLVVCSNLLFYYNPDLREKIIDKVANTMAPGGYLVTGETERDILAKHNFHEVYEQSSIFQKKFRN